MTNIFIPLGGRSAWDDNELRYCLRSLETNLHSDLNVTIYSDHEVPWLRNANLKVVPRYLPPGNTDRQYENFWDTLNKIHEFVKESEVLIFYYVYDDCCLIRPCDSLRPVDRVALEYEYKELARMRGETKHGRTILQSISLLESVGPFNYNYETHIPRRYEAIQLRKLYDKFDILHQPTPSALATLYFNYFYNMPLATIKEAGQSFRASFTFEDDPDSGCYLAANEGEIYAACQGKMWLHYNDVGLRFSPNGIPILKEYIMSMFPNKSKFEA